MEKILAHLVGKIISSNSSEAHTLHSKSHFGENKEGKVIYSYPEALYLVEKGKMVVLSGKKQLPEKDLMKKLQKYDKKIQIKYPVFKDLREKGYVVKTALKFGAEFRVYEKGKKPGEEHARWIVFTDHESNKISWHEFSAKNRVAHSTKKKLLLAIVDDEEDVSYWEISWLKP